MSTSYNVNKPPALLAYTKQNLGSSAKKYNDVMLMSRKDRLRMEMEKLHLISASDGNDDEKIDVNDVNSSVSEGAEILKLVSNYATSKHIPVNEIINVLHIKDKDDITKEEIKYIFSTVTSRIRAAKPNENVQKVLDYLRDVPPEEWKKAFGKRSDNETLTRSFLVEKLANLLLHDVVKY